MFPTFGAEPPQRVVSMNVCTDQLAMMIAQPGQLHSVSWLAADPSVSALADQVGDLVLNHGLAEEVFLMKPDLILSGVFSTRATVQLLKRLGFHVEEFEPASSFDDIRKNITRMGKLLGNEERAHALIAGFDRELAELNAIPSTDQTLALYYANNYTSGIGTLADEIVDTSGLINLGKKLGYSGTVKLPLELLVTAEPDLVVGRDRNYIVPSKAQENFKHPAYLAITGADRGVSMESRYWVCGTPFTLNAARKLADVAAANQLKASSAND